MYRAFADVKLFSNPKKTNLNLPTMVKPDAKASYEKIVLSMPELPGFSALNVEIKDFKKTELTEIELPSISKLNVVVPLIAKAKLAEPALPTIFTPDIISPEIDIPKYVQMDLPSIAKPNVKAKSFEGFSSKQPELPVVVSVHFAPKFFDIERTQSNVVAPQIPDVHIKPTAKIKKANTKLPPITPPLSPVKIPDAISLLNELFPDRNEAVALEG